MKTELKKYTIGDILELQRGYDLTHSQMKKGDVIVVGSNGIIGSHNMERGTSPCITVGRSGTVGAVHYYNRPVWVHNTALFVKDFKGNVPLFLYYFLKNIHLDKLFGKSASVIPSLDRKVVHALRFPFQDKIEVQKEIVKVLANIDRKIELNKAINANLEAMAKQLYDYWFVQFDFPDANGRPYKSSGGKMLYNPKLKRPIPAGWVVVTIGDILDKYPNTKKYESKEYLPKGCFPIIDQGDSYIVGFTNEEEGVLNRHPAVLFGDHSTKVKLLDFPFARGADGTQILYSKHPNISQYYLYLVVLSLPIPNPGYSRHFKYLKELPIVVPDCGIAKLFEKAVTPIYKMKKENIFANIDLTALRDTLLPMLMNGQVSVL